MPSIFYGLATTVTRLALFRDHDNVIVVAEGELFLDRYRVVRIEAETDTELARVSRNLLALGTKIVGRLRGHRTGGPPKWTFLVSAFLRLNLAPLNWQRAFQRVRARSSRPVILDGSYRSSRQVSTMLSGEMVPNELIEKMRRDWDRRAVENHRYYIVNSRTDWSDEEFWKSGETSVSQYVLTDMGNVCQGRRPADMQVLDFGCGAGRVTRALAKVFGEVHGVDISGEMVGLARQALAEVPNVHIYHSSGKDLDVLGSGIFDFAFAFSVFHHIPGKPAISSCIAEVGKHLHPGDLFKFEVQGVLSFDPPEGDTWLGSPLSEADVIQIAMETGFQSRYRIGAGEESYWQWFFKNP